MALYVVQVPNPAAGRDWSYTIPGQFVEDVVAVSATLQTGGTLAAVADESGNGRNATIRASTDYTIGNRGPWGGGTDNYAIFHPDVNVSANIQYANSATLAAFGGNNYSAEQWVQMSPTTTLITGLFNWQLGANSILGVNMNSGSANPFNVKYDTGGSTFSSTVLGAATRGAWHHLAVTYDNVNVRLYVDGVLFNTQAAAGLVQASAFFAMGGNNSLGSFRGYAAGPVAFGTTLTGGQVAAHYAARGSWAAYKAAVVADGAAGLWNIGKPATGPSRNVALRITNGTSTIGQYPPGTTPITGQAGYTYSWQSTLSSATQTPDSSVISVPIPELILPAGYTVGTTTSNIAATDQWTNINVWWNDDYQENTVNLGTYEYAPGALLRWRPYSPGL